LLYIGSIILYIGNIFNKKKIGLLNNKTFDYKIYPLVKSIKSKLLKLNKRMERKNRTDLNPSELKNNIYSSSLYTVIIIITFLIMNW